MTPKFKFIVILLLGLVTACTPQLAQESEETTKTTHPTNTAIPPTLTFTPAPTATTTDTPTPTSSPTATPTDTPTLSPTPELATIYGNLIVTLIPFGSGAEVPDTLGELALRFKNIQSEDEYRAQIMAPNGDYQLKLPAGSYKITGLDISALDTDGSTGSPSIIVPTEGCIYVGRLSLIYHRLPPLPIAEQIALMQQVAPGKDVLATISETGSLVLVLDQPEVDIPQEGERVEESETCEVQLVRYD